MIAVAFITDGINSMCRNLGPFDDDVDAALAIGGGGFAVGMNLSSFLWWSREDCPEHVPSPPLLGTVCNRFRLVVLLPAGVQDD